MFKFGKHSVAQSLIQEGDAARDRRDWQNAAAAYARALKEDPDLPAILVQYGHALKESGKLAEATDAYREATKKAPNDSDAFLQLGHALKLGGDRASAIAAYRKSLLLDPNSKDARRELRGLNAALPSRVASIRQKTSKDGLAETTICYDVSDLLNYFNHDRVPTGIQRVQMNVVESSIRFESPEVDVQVVAFSSEGNYCCELDRGQFLELCALSRSGSDQDDPAWEAAVRGMQRDVHGSEPIDFRPNTVLVNLGTSWWLQNYFLMIRNAKEQYGIRYVPFVHDCIPIITPEHCIKELTQDFISWLAGVFHHADGYIVNSKSTAKDLKFVARILGHSIDEPVVVHLDGKFDAPVSSMSSPLRSHGKDREPFVLFVSTIESRKNHDLCFDTWLQLIKSRGLERTPNLVCVGKKGWMVDAALARLKSSELLQKKVVLLSGISDGDLARLYRDCLFTVYPSSYEGWGLPVTESLSYGKVPLVATNSSLTEAGGDLAVYFDLRSQGEFACKLEELVDNKSERARLERRIADNFAPRDWSAIGDDIRAATVGVRRTRGSASAIGEIRLGRFERLSRNVETVIWEGMPSGERFRIGAGWNFPDHWGCWMAQPEAEIGFRIPDQLDQSGNVLFIASIQGVPARTSDSTFSIEAVGTGVKREGTVRAGQWIHRIVSIPIDSIRDRTVRIRFRSDTSVDLSIVTDGVDSRTVTLGVAGFMVCFEQDLLSRQRYLEAVQYDDLESLIARPTDAGDYSRYRLR